MSKPELASARKRRGVTRASITRLEDRVGTFEIKEEINHNDRLAIQRLLKRLETLDADFKTFHFVIVDLTDDEEALQTEQAALDDHDDRVAGLTDRIQELLSGGELKHSPSEAAADCSAPLYKQLVRIEEEIRETQEILEPLSPGPDTDRCLLGQLEEQCTGMRAELASVRRSITMLTEERPDTSDYEKKGSMGLYLSLGLISIVC